MIPTRHAAGYVSLLSAFPTKLKLRFFKSDPQQLAEVDPLLRQVLPLTKKVGPVHSLDTAKAPFRRVCATGGGTQREMRMIHGDRM